MKIYRDMGSLVLTGSRGSYYWYSLTSGRYCNLHKTIKEAELWMKKWLSGF